MKSNRLTPAERLMVAGGVGVLACSFLPWEKLPGYGSGTTAFDFLWTGIIPWIFLVGVASLVMFLSPGFIKAHRSRWKRALLAVCVIAAGLLLIRVVWNPGLSSYQRGIGMILTFAASLVSLLGAVWNVVPTHSAGTPSTAASTAPVLGPSPLPPPARSPLPPPQPTDPHS